MQNLPRIDYIIEKHHITERSETPRLAKQWQQVLDECQQQRLGADDRLRLALRSVDYITSFELPFRLLLIRAPQAINKLGDEFKIHSKTVAINGSKRGKVYSLNADLSGVPEDFQYKRSGKVRRLADDAITTSSYIDISKQTPIPRERLRLALTSGLLVTALDALLFFGIQRVAADVMALRKQGLAVTLSQADAFNSQTQTRREIPAYRLARAAFQAT
jgi:hypothetical protein